MVLDEWYFTIRTLLLVFCCLLPLAMTVVWWCFLFLDSGVSYALNLPKDEEE